MSAPVVLVADADLGFAEAIREKLEETNRYDAVYAVNNMGEAMALVNNHKIDILVTELFLFGGDGFTLLSHLHRVNRNSVIVLMSSLAKCHVFRRSAFENVDRVLGKPCEPETISDSLEQMLLANILSVRQQMNMDNDLSELIRSLGFSPHMKGYHYLREAIELVLQTDPATTCITKHIYPEIARNNRTTAGNVERSIRYATKSVWRKEHSEKWDECFSDENNHPKPSSATIIHALAEYYRHHNNDAPDSTDD